MDLQAAILVAIDDQAVLQAAKRHLGAAAPIDATECRQQLRDSRQFTLTHTLALLRKEALATICEILGIDARGKRAELERRLLGFARRQNLTSTQVSADSGSEPMPTSGSPKARPASNSKESQRRKTATGPKRKRA